MGLACDRCLGLQRVMLCGKLYHASIMAKTGESETVYGLAFETSSALGEVALGRGSEVIEVWRFSGPRRHAVEFLPTIEAICQSNHVRPFRIGSVYVSCGPGSFTGLRIGITAARMMNLALETHIVAVPTLEVIAQNAMLLARADPAAGLPPDNTGGQGGRRGAEHACRGRQPPSRVVVVLDAKRRRVYTAAFVRQDDRYLSVSDPVETDPVDFLAGQREIDESCAVLGEGVLYHREAVAASRLPILPESLYPPRAETVYRLGVARASEGRFINRRALIPTYIRPPEAEEKWTARHGQSRS